MKRVLYRYLYEYDGEKLAIFMQKPSRAKADKEAKTIIKRDRLEFDKSKFKFIGEYNLTENNYYL